MIHFDIMYLLVSAVYSAAIFGTYLSTVYEPKEKRLLICSISQAGFVFSSMMIAWLKQRIKKNKEPVSQEVDVELGEPFQGTVNAISVGPNFEEYANNPPAFELSITAPPSPYTGSYTQYPGPSSRKQNPV